MRPNILVSISALPKVGKNHLAYTAPDPIKVFCFNGGAEFVAKKFPEKQIDISNFTLPIVEDTDQQWASPIWAGFREQYQKDVDSKKYATFVLDTSTEIENFCQQAVLEDQQAMAAGRGKEKSRLATTEYLARNLRMKVL